MIGHLFGKRESLSYEPRTSLSKGIIKSFNVARFTGFFPDWSVLVERYYHPQSGRFISPDPIGYPYCLDLYAYANGDPINYHDPDGRFSAPALKKAGTYLISTVNGPRFQGGMQVLGGVFEMGVGVGMTYGTGGLALPVGAAVTTHGLDHFFTGMRTVFTGEIQSTITSHTLQMTGISRDTAEFLDNGASFVATLGATAYTQLGKIAAVNLPRLASIPTTVLEEVAVENALKVGNFTYTKTAANHLKDLVKRGSYKGELARPYMKSPHLVNEVMAATKPIPDPGGIPGGLRWDVSGTFRGSEGIWELVLHPENAIIYHFNFR